MEQQQGQDVQSKAKAYLQAKWLPGAVAVLALVIAIGGHAFTAINSIGFAKMSNKIDSLESFQTSTEKADGNQDRLLQGLQGEVVKQVRTIQALQAELAELRQAQAEHKTDTKAKPAGFDAVNQEAVRAASLAKKEQRPLANGVNPRFDQLIRSRMKPYWEAPPRRPGAEGMDDEDVVVLQFALDRQGNILDVQVANTSGQIEYDNSVVKAALRMAAIPEIARLTDEAFAQVKAFRLSIAPGQLM